MINKKGVVMTTVIKPWHSELVTIYYMTISQGAHSLKRHQFWHDPCQLFKKQTTNRGVQWKKKKKKWNRPDK